MATVTKSNTKSSNKNPVKAKSSQKTNKKPAKRIEGNLRSALSRQVIDGTYDIDQCRKDIQSFTVGMSPEWKEQAMDILDSVESSNNPDAYFRALCNNALTNKKHNYNGIPVIRYWV